MLWYVSFVDLDVAAPGGDGTPGGPGFLGAVLIDRAGGETATEDASALLSAHLGLDEGVPVHWEAAVFGMDLVAEDLPASALGRVLSAAEALALPDPQCARCVAGDVEHAPRLVCRYTHTTWKDCGVDCCAPDEEYPTDAVTPMVTARLR